MFGSVFVFSNSHFICEACKLSK